VLAQTFAPMPDRIVVNPNEFAPLRLLLFHHAGGSAAAMLPLARQLPAQVETTAFELAGRGVRAGETPARTFAAARDELLGKVRDCLDRPVVLFGHSLGGMLADSIARRLARHELSMVKAVILSACPVLPSRSAAKTGGAGPELASRRSDDQLRRQLIEYGGTPDEVLQTPYLLAHFVAVLGNDMQLADTAGLETEPDPPDVAYEIWRGESDRTLTPGDADWWPGALVGPPVVRTFAGGHFYPFNESVGAAAASLRDLVASQIAAASPTPESGQE
jgi:surfactin synthase thioesterase subunit